MLAYTFGLRHAFDADHIAAIDNVTRKLMQEGKRPVAVGFFFSLGHSTIVVLLSIAIAVTATALQSRFDNFTSIGGVVGTLVSALFLFAIAIANILVLMSIYRTFRTVKSGGRFVEEDLDLMLSQRGFMGRILRRFFHLIERSWHMYPLGVLFGLGFDTATEVGLLGISATQAAQGLSIWSILVFPALFTAGMSLMDTTDSILMLGAYGWAFVKPIRKLYYNLTITAVSVIIAVVVGGLEVLNLIGDRLGLTAGGGFWGAIGAINDNFGSARIHHRGDLCPELADLFRRLSGQGVRQDRGRDELDLDRRGIDLRARRFQDEWVVAGQSCETGLRRPDSLLTVKRTRIFQFLAISEISHLDSARDLAGKFPTRESRETNLIEQGNALVEQGE